MRSSNTAITIKNLSKDYRLFDNTGDRIKQFFSFGVKQYHRNYTAVKNISLEVERGETLGIIGKNGSGKSTLLQLICGILKPTKGEIFKNGRVSALLELGAGFTPDFTGRENVYFQGALMGLSKEFVDQRFGDITEFAGIGDFIDQPVRVYSSGMFVRLAFATMIHADADILIVDEALAVGDEAFQRKCFDKMSDYLSGGEKTLLLVSHNTRQVERVCSKVIWLENGSIHQRGSSKEICNAYQTEMHRSVLVQPGKKRPMPDAANSGELKVDSLYLTYPHNDISIVEFKTNASIKVVVKFECFVDLIQTDIIAGFQTSDSVFIAAANTGRLSNLPDFDVGKHRIECMFPCVNLIPGLYQLRLVFLDRNRRMMWGGHGIYTFQVLPTKECNVMRTPMGLIDMPFTWDLKNN